MLSRRVSVARTVVRYSSSSSSSNPTNEGPTSPHVEQSQRRPQTLRHVADKSSQADLLALAVRKTRDAAHRSALGRNVLYTARQSQEANKDETSARRFGSPPPSKGENKLDALLARTRRTQSSAGVFDPEAAAIGALLTEAPPSNAGSRSSLRTPRNPPRRSEGLPPSLASEDSSSLPTQPSTFSAYRARREARGLPPNEPRQESSADTRPVHRPRLNAGGPPRRSGPPQRRNQQSRRPRQPIRDANDINRTKILEEEPNPNIKGLYQSGPNALNEQRLLSGLSDTEAAEAKESRLRTVKARMRARAERLGDYSRWAAAPNEEGGLGLLQSLLARNPTVDLQGRDKLVQTVQSTLGR